MAEPAEVVRGVRQWFGAWWLVLLVGILCVAAGVVVLAEPAISLVTLAVVSGIFLLVDGVFEIAASFARPSGDRGLLALLGVLSLIAGTILVRHPIAGIVAVALLLGLWLLTFGAVRFIAAFNQPPHRVWNLILAALEAIAGIVIVATPGIGVATLALLVGIAFILRGLALCMVAWRLRALGHAAAELASAHPA